MATAVSAASSMSARGRQASSLHSLDNVMEDVTHTLCHVQIDARILDPPELKYADKDPVAVGRSGSWNLAKLSFLAPKAIRSFGVASFCSRAWCGPSAPAHLQLEVRHQCSCWCVAISRLLPILT